MKRIFGRLGLAILLSLAWLAIAQAQESDGSNRATEPAADPERFRAMAEEGDPDAQYALAHSYHLGMGVEQDLAAAMVWYRKAAQQGDERAQLALGDQYRIGLAVPQNLAQSTSWYRMAADRGNAFAQYELGNAYRYGYGVQKSLVQAIQWYVLAAEAGNPSADLALAELEAADAVAAEGTPPPVPPAPEPDLSQDAALEPAASEPEAQPALAEPATAEAGTVDDEAAMASPEIEAAPAPSEDDAVLQLLASADRQVARLTLTTPAGDNAYETYQQVLSVQPDNEAAREGIERIGVKYVELARLAAARGEVRRSRRYAAKAEALAPENPVVRSMVIPLEPDPQTAKESGTTTEVVTAVTVPAPAPAARDEDPAEIAKAAATGQATPNVLVHDTDDVIFNPHAYQDREVVVAGSVVRLLGFYRLKSETRQNSLVINIDGLSRAERANLQTAMDKAGFLGRVAARIRGRIVRQTPLTYELAASELTLGASAAGKLAAGKSAGSQSGPGGPAPDERMPGELVSDELGSGTGGIVSGEREPDLEDAPPPVALLDPGAVSVEPESSAPWTEPSDPGSATSGGGTVGASAAAPAYSQAAPAYVPTCYQDTVWRRLPDGRIQTGTRTRCY